MIRKLFKHSSTVGLWQHKADGPLDSWFLILVMALMTIGIIMMFSGSYVYALYYEDNPYYYLKRQAMYAAFGIVGMILASKIKLSFYQKHAKLIMAIAVALLIIVLFSHTTVEGSGESFKRWIGIGFGGRTFFTFQPSDLAKFALIVFLAYVIDNNKERIEKDWRVMVVCLVIIGVVCGLVILEKHLSGTILLGGIGIAMTYLGGANKWWYRIGIIFLVLTAAFLIINMNHLPGYVQGRLKGWLDPTYDPTSTRWQTNQSLYAIGSGGLFGTGLGGSKQKHLYLPEPYNDFVFAVVCEELGYIRTVGIIILYGLLVYRGFYIGMRTKDKFASLVVMGIIAQVGLQTFLNIGVVTGMLPNTGISLPFFSYGGTALMTLLVEMGVVLSASRGIKKEI